MYFPISIANSSGNATEPSSDIEQLSDFTIDISEDTTTKSLLLRVQTKNTRMETASQQTNEEHD